MHGNKLPDIKFVGKKSSFIYNFELSLDWSLLLSSTLRINILCRLFVITSQKSRSDAILVDFQNKNGQRSEDDRVFGLLRKIRRSRERKIQKKYLCVGWTLTRLDSIPNIPTKMAPDDWKQPIEWFGVCVTSKRPC